MTGEECFEALREIREDVPVIIMSGYSRRAVTARLRGQGTSGFLQKPYQSRELLAAVRQALS